MPTPSETIANSVVARLREQGMPEQPGTALRDAIANGGTKAALENIVTTWVKAAEEAEKRDQGSGPGTEERQ